MPGGLQTCLHVSAHVLRSLLRMIMFLKFMLRDPYGIHYWRCLWIHAIGHELLQHKMGALVGYWLVVEGSDGMQTMDHLLSWPQVGTGTLPAFWRLYYFCPFPAIDPLSLHRNLRAPGNLIYNPLKVFWKETEKVISLSQMVPRSMLSLRRSAGLLEMMREEGGSNYISREEWTWEETDFGRWARKIQTHLEVGEAEVGVGYQSATDLLPAGLIFQHIKSGEAPWRAKAMSFRKKRNGGVRI